ncbi:MULTISPECIES: acyl carrier protein [Luteibacter]|jgi:acyl carrier protein|uniref:acyl carrier protein n=1 Tax=Luteibacter sp. dw_328 TaxID=2719796 RepID=UPI0007BFCC6C|nr:MULTISPECIES: acyl carrier protein [Luteibacter]
MNHQDVVAQLIELVTPIAEGRVAVITENTGITSELGLDSLRVMDLVVAVEDQFDISVPINALAEVRTVGDFASLIQKSAGENA